MPEYTLCKGVINLLNEFSKTTKGSKYKKEVETKKPLLPEINKHVVISAS